MKLKGQDSFRAEASFKDVYIILHLWFHILKEDPNIVNIFKTDKT